jgi:transcriptional regulator with XRE-family HTH domain
MSAKPKPPGKNPDPLNVREVLAFQIRSRRVIKGWSQERLAFEAELDRTYVSAVERCTWNVSLSNIEKLALALDAKPFELLMPPTVASFPAPSLAHG